MRERKTLQMWYMPAAVLKMDAPGEAARRRGVARRRWVRSLVVRLARPETLPWPMATWLHAPRWLCLRASAGPKARAVQEASSCLPVWPTRSQ